MIIDKERDSSDKLMCPYCGDEILGVYGHMEYVHGLVLRYGHCPCGMPFLPGELMLDHWMDRDQDHAILVAMIAGGA